MSPETNVRIERHPFPISEETVKGLAWQRSAIKDTLADIRTAGKFCYVALKSQIALGYASAFDREASDLRALTRLAAQGAAGFLQASAAGKGDEVSPELGDGRWTIPGKGACSQAHAILWRDGWYAAAIARDDASMAVLAGIPSRLLQQSSTQSDKFMLMLKAALTAYREDPDSALSLVEETVELTRRGNYHIAAPAAAKIHGLLAQVLGAVIRRDAAEFHRNLVELMRSHKRFWSKNEPNDYEGWFAWGPMAMCCLAEDAGMKTNVDSEYLLPNLIRR